MKVFSFKLADEKAAAFMAWCEENHTTPYATASSLICDLLNSEVKVDEEKNIIGTTPIDFSCLNDLIFSTLEAATLAYDLISAKTIDSLPDWFRSVATEQSLKQGKTDNEIVMKLQSKPALLRMIIENEVRDSAKERDTKIEEKPTSPRDLSKEQKEAPRISYTNEEARLALEELMTKGWE